ncbi:hypothetical protein BKA65DRAFT_404485 [Rhexocercosporidium sp. MPI-PUGE-AT-0058]|nr:hypothetical protein BKA65DRAFT_404485 [Rhexocercosporidium sp. MPI-PUGE-AT-0058]
MTREEFSSHWYNKHAPLVIPMFLHLGVQHYQQVPSPYSLPAPLCPPPPLHPLPLHLTKLKHRLSAHPPQIHGPFTTTSPDLNLHSFDGVAGLPSQEILAASSSAMPKWVQAYYDEVVKVDERRFLVSEALDHIVRVPPRTVEGVVRVVIQEGKALVEVPEGVWRVWREYEVRGREEEEEGEAK